MDWKKKKIIQAIKNKYGLKNVYYFKLNKCILI